MTVLLVEIDHAIRRACRLVFAQAVSGTIITGNHKWYGLVNYLHLPKLPVFVIDVK